MKVSLSGVEKEESPSMTIIDELTYRVNIRSADEVSPSALDSNQVLSSNSWESDVRCRGLVFDPVDRVFR